MRFIFWGTSEFAADILKGLLNIRYKPILVITQPDKPSGRGYQIKETPVKKEVKIHNLKFKDKIEIWQPSKLNKKFANLLRQLNLQFGILAAYGKIIPQDILNIFEPFGIINIHPSLLPKYRGPSPIQATIINNEKESGITLIKLSKDLDAGPIIAQEKIAITQEDTTGSLEKKMAIEGVKLLKKILPNYLTGKLKIEPQDNLKATYTSLIKKNEARINFDEPADLIERKIRAYQPWPIAYTYFENIRIQILKASVLKKTISLPPSTFFVYNQKLCLKVKDGGLLIEKLKPAGKKEMSSEDFLRGFLNKNNKLLPQIKSTPEAS